MRLMTKFMMMTVLAVSLAGFSACQKADQNISPNIAQEGSQIILAAQSAQSGKTAPAIFNEQAAKEAPKLKGRTVTLPGLQNLDLQRPDLQHKDIPSPNPEITSNDKLPLSLNGGRAIKAPRPEKNSRIKAVEVQTTPYQNPPKQFMLDQVINPASNSTANVDTQIVESAPLETAPAPLETVPAPVKHWRVDASKSHLKFTATQEGQPFDGEFKSFSADIQFHPDNLAGSSVTVRVPISDVDAGSTDRNSTLPGKAWFSVKAFPDAVFTAQDFVVAGDGAYIANGTLSMKGAERPLSLPFTLDLTGDMAVMRSLINMNRTQWDIGEKPWNTDEWVGTNVELDIAITAQAAP